MNKIITLTVNPVIDKSSCVTGIQPNSKLRCTPPTYEPGGGGVNVSRAVKKLGGSSICFYLSGGPSGDHLKKLLTQEDIKQLTIPVLGWTRDNLSITDMATNQQYRFVMPGAEIKKEEWQHTLKLLEDTLSEGDFLVASGSLPPGIPDDFYAKVSIIARNKKAKLILDTSGKPLLEGAKEHVYLLKPNLGELAALCGVTSIAAPQLEQLAKQFLSKKTCEILVVSLGPKGALLVTEKLVSHIPAPTIHQKSTIGAGDSMVAGMVLSLANGKTISEMGAYGVACGSAATINPGTQLCKKEDADQLYEWIQAHQKIITK